MAKSSLAASVLEDAAKKAKDRAEAIRKEIAQKHEQFNKAVAPLHDELEELEEAIARITGRGARRSTSRSSSADGRQRLSPEERENQVYEVILAHPEGVNGKQIADQLGVSTATATKAVNSLIASGRVKAEGERRARKLTVA